MTPEQARTMQSRLGVTPDGVLGPVSFAALFNRMAGRILPNAVAFGRGAARHFPAYGITTPFRLAHFMAQAAHETGQFRYAREIWGPTPAQRGYEGRADLGNCIAGDGRKFLGRGVFQCTGRDNYQRYGQRMGLDLACSPELAEQPEVGLHIACLYWSDKRLNDYADADNILAVSNGINRGNPKSLKAPNGLADRKAMLARAKGIIL